jgi:hypothetical protein
VAAHAVNNGVAAGILLATGAPEEATSPLEAVGTLAVGAVALGILLAAYRAASPAPPPAADAVVLADPSSPSISWRPDRVPRGLAAALLAGIGALLLLALAGIIRAR